GSIRPLIALILKMLCVIIGLYPFRMLGEGGTVSMRGLTADQVSALGRRLPARARSASASSRRSDGRGLSSHRRLTVVIGCGGHLREPPTQPTSPSSYAQRDSPWPKRSCLSQQ